MKANFRASAVGAPGYTATLPCESGSALKAREFVSAALCTWHLSSLRNNTQQIVTELVANAAEHTRSQVIRVTITRIADEAVRVDVVDKDRAEPTPRTAGLSDEHGRGMAIVAALAERWGADRLRWGKRVWAEVGEQP